MRDVRLYWAGHLELGGVLKAAPDARTALRRAHDEICGCGERPLCLREEGVFWDVATVRRLVISQSDRPLGRLRISLTRENEADIGPWRVWWACADDNGRFVIARNMDEARSLVPEEFYHLECVTEVDGLAVVVETRGSDDE